MNRLYRERARVVASLGRVPQRVGGVQPSKQAGQDLTAPKVKNTEHEGEKVSFPAHIAKADRKVLTRPPFSPQTPTATSALETSNWVVWLISGQYLACHSV